jgi:hypothetical protein
MSKADDRAWLNRRHVVCLDRIAELKAKPARSEDEKERLDCAIEAAQFIERELENL